MIGNLRRHCLDGDNEAKIEADTRFYTSFNFLRAIVRTEGKRFADIAPQGTDMC